MTPDRLDRTDRKKGRHTKPLISLQKHPVRPSFCLSVCSVSGRTRQRKPEQPATLGMSEQIAPLSCRLASSTRNPCAHAVAQRKPNDQSDCDFQNRHIFPHMVSRLGAHRASQPPACEARAVMPVNVAETRPVPLPASRRRFPAWAERGCPAGDC
jgi:hypothetical protein